MSVRARWPTIAIALALVAATFAVYSPVARFGFLSFDDLDYVAENEAVSRGLSADSVRWAFTAFHSSNWHPLTWISHMLDCELFGLDAGKHHLVSVALHALNALLCFALLLTTTGRRWASAFVAAAFALHPLRVQSVAWISERKDVLATLFFLSALLLYVRYARRPGVGRYLAVAAAFGCALLAKPSAVTFPLVALLFDRWPLRRDVPWRRLMLEKLPLVALAAGSVAITVLAQRESGALSSLAEIALGDRVANAFTGYGFYVVRGLVPLRLAYFYPHPAIVAPEWNAWNAVTLASALGLVVATLLALRSRRGPVIVGWLWFLGTLVPMIGLVQVGEQAVADRYAYLPLVGIAIVLAFGARFASGTHAARLHAGALALLLAGWATLAAREVPHWRDSEALFTRALETTHSNYMAESGLAGQRRRQGRLDEARTLYLDAIDHRREFPEALFNLGLLEHEAGDAERAAYFYRRALRYAPGMLEAHLNLGALLGSTGDLEGAVEAFAAVLALTAPASTDNASAVANLQGLASHVDGLLRGESRAENLGRLADRIDELLRRARLDREAAR